MAVYRRFLYLDGEEILNALATLEGGGVEEVVRRVLKEQSGDASLELPLWAAKLSFGGKKSKRVEEEVRLKRTAHAAVGVLLDKLRDSKDGRGQLTVTNKTKRTDLLENIVVQAVVTLGVVANQDKVYPPARPEPANVFQRFWWFLIRPEPDARWTRQAELARSGIGEDFVAEVGMVLDNEEMITGALQCKRDYLLCPLEDFSRTATVVAQIGGVPGPDEAVGYEDFHGGTRARIVRRDPNTLVTNRVADVLLHPLCVYK
jgi:hypothetical protein